VQLRERRVQAACPARGFFGGLEAARIGDPRRTYQRVELELGVAPHGLYLSQLCAACLALLFERGALLRAALSCGVALQQRLGQRHRTRALLGGRVCC
jgi:hypothetical protein